MHIDAASGRDRLAHRLVAIEQRRVHRGILVDGHRALAPVVRRDQPQPPLPSLGREMRLFVAGLDAAPIGLDPDLQQVGQFVLRRIELAVHHAATGAHALHVARPDGRAVAHVVLERQRAAEDVGDDFHVAVPVAAEAAAGLDAVFADHPQRAEAHVFRVMVAGKRDRPSSTPTAWGSAQATCRRRWRAPRWRRGGC
jgi:hypothetical protein